VYDTPDKTGTSKIEKSLDVASVAKQACPGATEQGVNQGIW